MILADNGYVSEEQVKDVQKCGIEVFLPVFCDGDFEKRNHDWRPKKEPKEKTANPKPWIKKMSEKMQEESSRKLYRLRKQTVEPVFGIVKDVLGYRQFHLRGLENMNNEWTLLMTAYNVKRLANLVAKC